MKKFVAMMLVAGFLLANVVGCGGDAPKPAAKDKDAKPSAPKEKDAK
ncbi:MAG: hypothetical protein U0736_12895 [Gemmataceae bacterium]